MKCPRCDADTAVVDSRPAEMNTIRRRRQCIGCGHRFTTWESRQRPSVRDRSDYFRDRYAAQSPEVRKRKALRRQAQAEARRTGEPVAAIYARWGCE